MPPAYRETIGVILFAAVPIVVIIGAAYYILLKKRKLEFNERYALFLGLGALVVLCMLVVEVWRMHDGEAFRFSDLPDGHWRILVRDNKLGNTLIENKETGVVLHTRLIVGRPYPSEFVRMDGKDYPVDAVSSRALQSSP